jgi:DNA-3-methyladenine glycosylase I
MVSGVKEYLKIMDKGPGFSNFIWNFVDGKPRFKFVGPPLEW